MPEVTVSMPAFNSELYIKKAIESVLKQVQVDFELVVVDDCSIDNTYRIANSFDDKRINVIRNEENKGIAYCHNLVIEISKSPFIIHVDSDDIVFERNAFRKMIDRVKESSHIGQVHCYFFNINTDGFVSIEDIEKTWKNFHNYRPLDTDYRKDLIIKGSIMNGLRTYRRDIFMVIGNFNEKLVIGEDIEMAMRILDKYEIKLVPAFLYCTRIHDHNITKNSRGKVLQYLYRRTRIAKRLQKENRSAYFNDSRYNINKLFVLGLTSVLKLRSYQKRVEANVRKLKDYIIKLKDIKFSARINFYKFLCQIISCWPIKYLNNEVSKNTTRYIAYYIKINTEFSQGFIKQKIVALLDSGMSLNIVVDNRKEVDFLYKIPEFFDRENLHFEQLKKKDISKYRRYFISRNPFRYISLFFYILANLNKRDKSYKYDNKIFNKVILLSGLIKDKKVGHLHTTFEGNKAIICLLASKFVGISFSVENGSYDFSNANTINAIFSNAKFIICNSLFKNKLLQSHLDERYWQKLHTIYDGIGSNKISLRKKIVAPSGIIQIISIGRIAKQSGFEYLILACNILKNEGFSFKCEFITMSNKSMHINYYIKLKVLLRNLNLENYVEFVEVLSFDKILDKVNRADVYVFPHLELQESDYNDNIYSKVLIKAMKAKIPVVSTNLSPLNNILDNKFNGILISLRDENALAVSILKLSKDERFRSTITNNAVYRINQVYDADNNIRNYIQLFQH